MLNCHRQQTGEREKERERERERERLTLASKSAKHEMSSTLEEIEARRTRQDRAKIKLKDLISKLDHF